MQGHHEFVQYLISRQGVNPNLADYRGVTPLLAAILHGQALVASSLLNLDSLDINCTDSDSRTPLLAAVSQGMPDIVVRLVSCSRLRLDCVSGEGKTALQVARDTGQLKIAEIIETAETTRSLSSYLRIDSQGNNIEQRLRDGFRYVSRPHVLINHLNIKPFNIIDVWSQSCMINPRNPSEIQI